MRTFYGQKELKKKSALMLSWLPMLVHKTTDKTNCIDIMHLSVVCLRMGAGGGGGGQPTGNLPFPVFKCQFPRPWVSILSQIPIPGAN